MNILLVHAQPESTSLTRHLVNIAMQVLTAQGHTIVQSDLYRMGWKAVFDEQDFPERGNPERLSFIDESRHAFTQACQTADVEQEQRKVLAADVVIFLFPLWWFSMPAIMKGWIERVWAYGLAYGYQNKGNAYRYGEGVLRGSVRCWRFRLVVQNVIILPGASMVRWSNYCSLLRTARCFTREWKSSLLLLHMIAAASVLTLCLR